MDGWGTRRWISAVVVGCMMLAAVAAHPGRGTVTIRAADADSVVGTVRVDVSSAGVQAARSSSQAALSASGRYVAFVSGAANLVPHDRNRLRDVFVRDLRTSTTSRAMG